MDVDMTEAKAASLSDAVSRDPASFERIYEIYRAHVYRFARALTGDSGEADDLFQDTWLRVAQAFGRRPAFGDLRAWIFTITANLHKDALRKKRVRRLFWLEKTSIPGWATDGGTGEGIAGKTADGDCATRVEFRMCLGRALAALPAKQKRVFVLKEIEGFRHAEIGGILGIPENTVRTLLHRAVKTLRGELRRLGIASTHRKPQGEDEPISDVGNEDTGFFTSPWPEKSQEPDLRITPLNGKEKVP